LGLHLFLTPDVAYTDTYH